NSCASGFNCSALNPSYPESCSGCMPPLYGLGVCLANGAGTCTDDLPEYLPADGPFDSSNIGNPFAPCASVECDCNSSSVLDFFLSKLSHSGPSTYCEQYCFQTSECAWPQTYCSGQVCAIDRATCKIAIQGGASSNLGAACSIGGTAGTCVYFS